MSRLQCQSSFLCILEIRLTFSLYIFGAMFGMRGVGGMYLLGKVFTTLIAILGPLKIGAFGDPTPKALSLPSIGITWGLICDFEKLP